MTRSNHTLKRDCAKERIIKTNLIFSGTSFFKNIAFRNAAELGSTGAVKQAVKSGRGVTMISALAVAEALRHKTLEIIPFKGKKLVRNFFIIVRHGRTLASIGKAFWDFLTKHPTEGKD